MNAPRPAGAPNPAVLLLNAHLPVFPGGGGVEALTTRHLAGLAEAVGLVSQAHTPADVAGARALADAGVRLYLWEAARAAHVAVESAPPPAWLAAAAAWRDGIAGLLRGQPADTSTWQRALKRLRPALAQALREREWPVVFVVESAAAGFLDALPRPTLAVLVLHDVRARLYATRAAAAESAAARLWWRAQARLYARFERRHCRRYDLVTTVSASDAAWLCRHARPRDVAVVPLPVDADYFAPADPAGEQPGRIVFTGHLAHAPNADAAVFFAREVLPRVRARVPAAHFHVVGKHAGREVRALAALPGVTVTGAVPDVRPQLAAAQVAVAPLRFGAGARQKILEAWALERCVVATPLGADGLDAVDGVNVLLAEGAEALAERVARALGDAGLRDAVRRTGRRAVLERHAPARVAAGLYARVCELYAAKTARPRR